MRRDGDIPRYDEELTVDQAAYLHELADERRRRWRDHDIRSGMPADKGQTPS